MISIVITVAAIMSILATITIKSELSMRSPYIPLNEGYPLKPVVEKQFLQFIEVV